MKFYKGYKGKSKQEEDAFYKEFERLKLIANERSSEEKLQASDFCMLFLSSFEFSSRFFFKFQFSSIAVNRSALKGIGIGVTLTSLAQLTGNFAITNYAVMIFEKTGTSVDPYISSIMLAVALILGAICTTYLADQLGRKFLNIASVLGSAVGLFAVSIYHYLNMNGYDLAAFEWVPVVSLSFVIFISSAGIMALSLVCSIEYLPPKVRRPFQLFTFIPIYFS